MFPSMYFHYCPCSQMKIGPRLKVSGLSCWLNSLGRESMHLGVSAIIGSFALLVIERNASDSDVVNLSFLKRSSERGNSTREPYASSVDSVESRNLRVIGPEPKHATGLGLVQCCEHWRNYRARSSSALALGLRHRVDNFEHRRRRALLAGCHNWSPC